MSNWSRNIYFWVYSAKLNVEKIVIMWGYSTIFCFTDYSISSKHWQTEWLDFQVTLICFSYTKCKSWKCSQLSEVWFSVSSAFPRWPLVLFALGMCRLIVNRGPQNRQGLWTVHFSSNEVEFYFYIKIVSCSCAIEPIVLNLLIKNLFLRMWWFVFMNKRIICINVLKMVWYSGVSCNTRLSLSCTLCYCIELMLCLTVPHSLIVSCLF